MAESEVGELMKRISEQVDDIKRNMRRLEDVHGAYQKVVAHLRTQTHVSRTLSDLLERHHDVATEHREYERELAKVRATCSHAFERIGEAKPPFTHCIECGIIGPARNK